MEMMSRSSISERIVFLSYSRRDAGIVRKLQLIVWASGATPWRDEAAIPPGAQWRVAISRAIDTCERILVFWCCHARDSDEVRREYREAIECDKPVVPVTLDHTVVPDELRRYQVTDVSSLVGWNHRFLSVERWLWIGGW